MANGYRVSRPIDLEAGRGIVELVRGHAPDTSEGHPPHWHSQWQVVAVTGGDGWVRVRGSRHRTSGGSLFLIPPEIVHSNGVYAGGCDFRSLLIEPETVEEIAAARSIRLERSRIVAMPVLQCREWTSRFDRFHRSLHQSRTIGLEQELGVENWVAGLLARQTSQAIAPLAREQAIHPAARRAREFLADHAGETVSLERLGLASGLSPYELSRRFKAAYGLPPHRWQLQVRVERAKDRLRRGIPVGEVALELGFADQPHFSRVFKRATGYSPARLHPGGDGE